MLIPNHSLAAMDTWDPPNPLKKGEQKRSSVPPFLRGARGDRGSVVMKNQFGITLQNIWKS
jgi:hypothetical protein